MTVAVAGGEHGREAMASKHLSPTANLLRHSRLFSLPPPLPRPSHDSTGGTGFASETATLPYPTHAAIETTQSSLSRGDWGLKRPLPQQSTAKTTTPIIRIAAVDSIDHITNFDSAADHALTLRKWQEMGVPISMPALARRASQMNMLALAPSVFEKHLNSTQAREAKVSTNTVRWKYRGPWLAGKTEGGFHDYVEKEVKRRRAEFHRYLRVWLRKKKGAALQRAARDEGEEFRPDAVSISDSEFQSEIIRMRQESTDLWGVIWEFLDLPGLPPQHIDQDLSSISSESNRSLDQDLGPPVTHPSAGLSYVRTASHVPNHPVLGPMSSQQPVRSRILQSQSFTGGYKQGRVVLGVGGVVAADSSDATFKQPKNIKDPEPGWSSFDPDIEGGAKTWIHPEAASIDSEGRIKLNVDRASKDTVAVWEGQAEKIETLGEEVKGEDRRAPNFDSYFQNPFGSRTGEGQRESKPKPIPKYGSKVSDESQQELMDLLRVAGANPNIAP